MKLGLVSLEMLLMEEMESKEREESGAGYGTKEEENFLFLISFFCLLCRDNYP